MALIQKKTRKIECFPIQNQKKASNTNNRPTLATYGYLAVATDAKQVSYSHLLDNKVSTGMYYVATSWQLPQRIPLFSNIWS